MKSKKIKLAIFTAKNIITSTGSTNTVLNLLDALDQTKYKISLITIDSLVPKYLKTSPSLQSSDPSYVFFPRLKHSSKISHCYDLKTLTLAKLQEICQFAIIAIYNVYGEDGRIIGLLETADIPYLSPSLKTSSLCFDKQMTKDLLRGNNILVPDGFEVHRKNFSLSSLKCRIKKRFKYPIMIKTTSCGASRGVSYIECHTKLKKAVTAAFKYCDSFLVEPFLAGQEFTVGLYGHYLAPQVLPVVEIISANDFFDFEAKYNPNKCQEVCPANISQKLFSRIQKIAIKTYRTVKGESHARIDMIYYKNKLYVLEINTFPGLTTNSLFPKELQANRISLSEFLDSNIQQAKHFF